MTQTINTIETITLLGSELPVPRSPMFEQLYFEDSDAEYVLFRMACINMVHSTHFFLYDSDLCLGDQVDKVKVDVVSAVAIAWHEDRDEHHQYRCACADTVKDDFMHAEKARECRRNKRIWREWRKAHLGRKVKR